MTFANRLPSLNSLALACLLATAGTAAFAQTAPGTPAPATGASQPQPGHHMGRHDPAKMQAWIAKRNTELKARLKITPQQEGAWTAYTAALQPPAHGARPTAEQRAEFDKLTTPQRIDKMRAMRSERMAKMSAAMDKRDEATKTFYAALSPEQQKTFDAEHMKRGHHGEGRGGRGGPQAPQGQAPKG